MMLSNQREIHKRLLTGSVLVLLGLLSIFKLPEKGFLVLSWGLVGLAAWEWSGLLPNAYSQSLSRRIYYCMGVLLASILAYPFPLLTLVLAGIYWLVVLGYMAWLIYQDKSPAVLTKIQIASGVIVLAPCWIGVNYLHQYSPYLLLYALIIVYSVDIAGYFLGSWVGRHKLCVRISAGKTMEGWIAGLILSMVAAYSTRFLASWSQVDLSFVLCMSMGSIAALFGLLGDLWESVHKRTKGVKNSGQIFPGHGGLLDRIDSLTAAIPFITLLLYFQRI